MDGWISQSILVEIVTIVFILSAVINRSKRTKLQGLINAAAIALIVSLTACFGGYRDLAMSIAGAAAGAVLAVPLYHARWMTRTDVSTCCVVGARLGPLGLAIAFGIALGFLAAQRLVRARATVAPDPLFSEAPYYPLMRLRANGPSLAEMESQRILREDCTEWIVFDKDRRDTAGAKAPRIPIIRVRDEVMPWPCTIALAALAVLMLGIPR